MVYHSSAQLINATFDIVDSVMKENNIRSKGDLKYINKCVILSIKINVFRHE